MDDYSQLSQEEMKILLHKQASQISELEKIASEQKAINKQIKEDERRKDILYSQFVEILKDRYKTIDDFLEFAVEGIKQLGSSLDARFYKVVEGIDDEVKEFIKEKENLHTYTSNSALYWLYDTRIDPRQLPDLKRHMGLRIYTTTGDTAMKKIPVNATSQVPSEEEKIYGIEYRDDLGNGRFEPFISNRAAFPILSKTEKDTADYVVVVDKYIEGEDDKPFTGYELRAVRSFVDRVNIAYMYKLDQQELRRGMHDLKNPLFTMSALSKKLIRIMDESEVNLERCKNYVSRIEQSSDYSDAVATQLLSGNYSYPIEKIDLRSFFEKEISQNRLKEYSSLIYSGVECELNINMNIQDSGVVGNDLAMMRVFSNMVNNSFESYKEQSNFNIPLKISFEARKHKRLDNYIMLEYIDNAGGMDDQTYHEVWESKREYSTKSYGSGLGVNIVKDLCGKMGWKIDMINTPEEGIKYQIMIPIKN